MSRAQALLEVHAAVVRAGPRVLVRELDLRVHAGQRWAVIGRNGAGKSTLLRLLAGLHAQQGARLSLAGQPMARLSPAQLAGRRAYMPSVPHDRFGITVLDAVMLGQREPDGARALEQLRRVDADALARRSLLGLSAGERQRVALAQVMAQGAALLLLDEPASFQDPRHQTAVAGMLRAQVPVDAPGALVCSAHDLNWVASLATHVLALLPDGGWRGGAAAEMLSAELLQQVYGCAWQRIPRDGRSDLWVALD